MNCRSMSTIDSPRAMAVVSKAVPRPETTPVMLSSCEGERQAIASVMPMTVPKKPMIGIAQITNRTRP